VAYALVFVEGFWSVGRYIAGWYAIFVVVVVLAAFIITISAKWGPVQTRTSWLDYFFLR